MARSFEAFQKILKTNTSKLTLIVAVLVAMSSCAVTQHVDTTDMTDMKCPSTPKCVSSEESNTSQVIERFSFNDEPKQAMVRLKAALLSESRVTIIHEQPNMLSAEVRSSVFGFVDDVRFVLLPGQGVIQVRSSARMGYSDLGVNRRRIERVRKVFNEGDL